MVTSGEYCISERVETLRVSSMPHDRSFPWVRIKSTIAFVWPLPVNAAAADCPIVKRFTTPS
jgi:hypothetical protein